MDQKANKWWNNVLNIASPPASAAPKYRAPDRGPGDNVRVIASISDLAARGLRDRRVAGLVEGGGWYLVGSRAAGFSDHLSDWDTLLLSRVDVSYECLPAEVADEVFGVERPSLDGPPTLGMHERWRSVQAVEVMVLGPAARRRRAVEQLAEWAFELQHALPLSPVDATAESYRRSIAARFRRYRTRLATAAYIAFRRARNQAVASLARPDPASQALTAASCVNHAGRFWLLAEGQAHPATKWLLAALRSWTDGRVLGLMGDSVDLRLAPAERFEALWQLWTAIDQHAQRHGIAAAQLAGSPFAHPATGDRTAPAAH
jgi:hypothetical protein